MNSPVLKSYEDVDRSEEARHWAFAQYACYSAPLVTVGIFLLYFRNNVHFLGQDFVFGVSLCAIAAILAGTYYYTYKLFNNDKFYFFISASWVANAIYLIPEWIGPSYSIPEGIVPRPDPQQYQRIFQQYQTSVFFLSLVSSVFLLLAFHYRSEKKPERRRLIIGTTVGLVLFVVDILLINYELPQDNKTQAYWMLVGSCFAFLILWVIGDVLTVHLKSEIHGRNLRPIRYTFWLYGLLQFIYPFKPYLVAQKSPWSPAVFVIAQLAKVGNAIAIIGVLQAVSAYRDIKRDEESKEAEHQLRLEKLELEAQESRLLAGEERLQRESQYIQLGKLAASIKHDINTPLATLSFDVGAVKERYQHDKWTVRKMESMEESMNRISATVKVVDYFQGDKAYYNRDKIMVKASMLEVVHRAVKSVKNEREELKQINARSKIKISGRDVWVRANVPMLEQLIVNVIKNGLEAIEEAERKSGLININVGTTKLAESEYSRWVKVEVEDNGCGIPKENIEKLTTLFTTRGDKKPNSGIGLFIGKKILDIHDGDIKFQSTEGQGTTVTLLLPEWHALQKQQERASVGESAAGNVDESNGEEEDKPYLELNDVEVVSPLGEDTLENSGEHR